MRLSLFLGLVVALVASVRSEETQNIIGEDFNEDDEMEEVDQPAIQPSPVGRQTMSSFQSSQLPARPSRMESVSFPSENDETPDRHSVPCSALQTFREHAAQPAPITTPSAGTCSMDVDDVEDDPVPDAPHHPLVYGPAPPSIGNSRVLFNEICTDNDAANGFVFLEIIRRLDGTRSPQSAHLAGFSLAIIEWFVNEARLLMVNHFSKEDKFTYVHDSVGQQTGYYYTLSSEMRPGTNKLLQDTCHISRDNKKIIRRGSSGTFAVILMYFPPKDKHQRQKIRMSIFSNTIVKTVVTSDMERAILGHVQDAVIYGLPRDSPFFSALYGASRVPVHRLILPDYDVRHPHNDQTAKPFMSMSRCDFTTMPGMPGTWILSSPTFAAPNSCSPKSIFLLGGTLQNPFKMYRFHGKQIFLQSKQIILNTWTFFTKKKHLKMQKKSAIHLTGAAVNLNLNVISRIVKEHKAGNVQEPSRKRNRPFYIQSLVGPADRKELSNIIKGFFKKGFVAVVDDIHTEFMTYMANRTIPGSNKPFHCSKRTMVKILKKMNYKHATIDKRAAILQRPDLVLWRIRFLREYFSSTLPIVWLDESWVDPYARIRKGWVKRFYDDKEDRAAHSFWANRIGRGPRIIMLNAGGVNGFIEGMMKVYLVKKNADDYHKNINYETFRHWFECLCVKLAETGPHLIILDNAPYHSRLNVPGSEARKPEIYNWLMEKKDAGLVTDEIDYTLTINEMRAIINRFKESPEYYRIDLLAKSFGHKVLRLPPYQCDLNPIEYVWKDIKYATAKFNVNQKPEEVKRLLEEVMGAYNASDWQKHIAHTHKKSKEYWEEDTAEAEVLGQEGNVVTSLEAPEPFNDPDDAEDIDILFDIPEEEIDIPLYEEEEESPPTAESCTRNNERD